MQQGFSIFPLGDGALTISFGNVIDEAINQKVLHLFHQIKTSFPFITDVVPAYGSLTIHYDILALHTKDASAFERIKEALSPLLQQTKNTGQFTGRHVSIPVCYAKK